ncbi:MAG: Rne/Rng family ribonuclease, partial [Proteobacteria bacterium]|nr:Rne/Rng family ribonuclease [Pseudomonadota bacterium]
KGNIYLAKVTRVEPSLQAAFVEYGAGKQGFLPFSEIHTDYYQIPVADRKRLLEEAASEDDNDDAGSEETFPLSTASNDFSEASYGELPAEDTALPPLPEISTDVLGESSDNDNAPFLSEQEQNGYMAQDSGLPEAIQPVDLPEGDAAPISETGEETQAEGGEATPAAEGVETLAGEDDLQTRPKKNNFTKRYKIQEVIRRGQIVLVQVIKEERGNKGASLTTYLSLAGRYCVLMPNSPKDGGISRKIASGEDRKRLKAISTELRLAQGMSVIIRTAGMDRTRAEIKRDFDYLVKLWNQIREDTLKSNAPALIYEESDIIKRAIRDQYSNDIDEVVVEGEAAYNSARDFMKLLLPSHTPKIKHYQDPTPLFYSYDVEEQLLSMHDPVVKLRSGGYIVINPTEALISIDVNSGRATGERNIEETAVKTNLEAAAEVARQLRLRDLAGLIVIDFIDMMESRNRRAVEKTLKDSLKSDRAKIQLGRISPFGLLEMSRQRIRPS